MVLEGDAIDVLPTLEPSSFHAMLTDPPYGLSFMGKAWDHAVPSAELWREPLRVLKPGAYALVFGGTRTWHRLAVALEDAGFEIRDTLMWVYGQGFPKSHNVGKKVSEWDGYGTALKPAWEPVILCRKPLDGTVAGNCVEHGAGALNIEKTRVGGHKGRWPANLIHDGSSEVTQHFPHTQTWAADTRARNRGDGDESMFGLGGINQRDADSGSAARFFYTAKASKSERNAGVERNSHPTVKPFALNEYLARLLLPPVENARILVPFSGSGSEMIGALQAGWSEAVGIEVEREYIDLANARIKHWIQEEK